MIISGIRKAHIKLRYYDTLVCPHCGEESIFIHIYRRHFHLFWIPMFPLNKIGQSECNHCKNVRTHKEMPEDFKQEYEILKKVAFGPFWQFTGVNIIIILFIWGNYASTEDKKTRTRVYNFTASWRYL